MFNQIIHKVTWRTIEGAGLEIEPEEITRAAAKVLGQNFANGSSEEEKFV